MEKVANFLNRYSFFAILFLSIPAVWALFVPGFYGASDDIHVAWLYEMDATLKAGQFPPRFVPDLSFGFGYPLFNFVFPLPFYLGEIFHFFGFSFVDSIKLVFVLSVPLSGFFMYKFLREFAGELISLAGAILYIYTPYRATDIFVRGAVGESLAFVFPPLIALSIIKIVRTKEIKWISVLGFSTVLLITSHNIMSYMFLPFLIGLAILLIFKSKTPTSLVSKRIFFGFVLGLLMSVYFWLPAIVESRYMKYDTVFNYSDHFPTIRQLITPYFGYGASVPGSYDGMSFFLGTLNLVLVVIGTYVFLKKRTPILGWALTTFFISIFLMNHRSTFLWKNVPFMPYFQFPWRFLSLTTFIAPILFIALDKIKYSRHIALIMVFGAIIFNFSYFRPSEFLGRQDDYYINRYIPVPKASEEYLQTLEEYLRLPKDTLERPRTVSPHIGLNTTFTLDNKEPFQFEYFKYNFPGWEAKIDGKKTNIRSGIPYGHVVFDVPVGKHDIRVTFKETPFRKTLDLISLLSILAGATMVLIPKKVYEK